MGRVEPWASSTADRIALTGKAFREGANWIRPDAWKRKWRAVVDQQAT